MSDERKVVMIGDGPRALLARIAARHALSAARPKPTGGGDPFPPPTRSYPADQRPTVEVTGGLLIRCETSQRSSLVVVVVLASDDEHAVLFRFRVPGHNRTVREWFRALGAREVPRHDWGGTVTQGAFPVDFAGTVVGEDAIPEGVPNPPKAAYVLENVTLLPCVGVLAPTAPAEGETPPSEGNAGSP
jgi:hypothetical protein